MEDNRNNANGIQEKLFVTFRSRDDIIHFVHTCSKYDDAIDVKDGRFDTDAKSVMGMLLLRLNEPFEIKYGCFHGIDGYEAFRREILQKFEAKTVALNKKW